MRILVRKNSISAKQNVLGICNPDRRINVLTTSPNQYPTYDTQEEVSATHECKDCVVVFDDVLERNQFKKLLPLFFIRGKHENIDVSYVSQQHFEIPLLIRIKSNNFLFEQTAKILQISFNGLAGFDIDCEEPKQLCNESWKDISFYRKTNICDYEEKVFIKYLTL